MVEKIHNTLRDSPVARWTALILLALTMFFAYMFIDVLAPLSTQLETSLKWSPDTFGAVAGSEYFLNVFAAFLIFAGIILDRIGVRRSAILSGILMVVGASIKLYGISDQFNAGGFGYDFFHSFWTGFPASAKVACVGFAIFGCGVEMAGITVSKGIVKWFAGKELALAMGLEMAIARLGVFSVFRLSPYLAEQGGITLSVGVGTLLLLIGLLSFSVYFFFDKKLDSQTDSLRTASDPEEEFKVSDLKAIFTSKTFMVVAGLCVLFYSAIFPFQKFATGMLESRLGMTTVEAGNLFSYFPIGAMILTPFLGWFIDHKGKAATMLFAGSLLVIICHLIFAMTPVENFTFAVALGAIILLGISFSLVPAALWPSVPKLVDNKVLGSAYSIIFWIQNIGLMLTPILIGWSLKVSNPGVAERILAGEDIKYNYTVPMVIFAAFGVAALALAFYLKVLDKKKGYGLESPNIRK
ncbi:MFS transporter [Proteiniphilum sp. X52]|uniref:MFS transporter n=1 Tax=Proteiniphilum sp. X52 TaxID=2382159 RepID=UPI00351A9BD5